MRHAFEHICETCGTQFGASSTPPRACPICEDDRQYVGWRGQTWTTHDALASRHTVRIGEEAGLLALGMAPSFAIDQRAFVLPTDAGNILWEALPIVTQEAVEAIRAHGGVDAIAISHPHFFASMVEWSEALGGVPILLHAANRPWIHRPHRNIELWSGDTLRLSPSVTLIRTGGHFAGSTALHWASGPRPGGALFAGDVPQVAMDRRHVSFMYSYPNLVPMRTRDVLALRRRLATYEYEDVFGYTWERNIVGGGRAAVDASFDRYLEAVRDERAETGLDIVVFGASGSIGRAIAIEALARGHRVTGVVRHPQRAAGLPEGLMLEQGDASKPDDVRRFSEGRDVVVSATRPSAGRELDLVRTAKTLTSALEGSPTRLLVVGGAAGLKVPGTDVLALDDPRFVPAAYRAIAEACVDQQAVLEAASGLDWTYVSPPAEIAQGERTARYRLGTDALVVDAQGRSRVSYPDFGVAIVDELEHRNDRNARFTVGYGA